jgi:chorismate mutase
MDEIEMLRKKIDEIDTAIIQHLAERAAVSRRVGEVKKTLGKKVLDTEREKYLENYHKQVATQYGLAPDFVEPLFKFIMANSRGLQK